LKTQAILLHRLKNGQSACGITAHFDKGVLCPAVDIRFVACRRWHKGHFRRIEGIGESTLAGCLRKCDHLLGSVRNGGYGAKLVLKPKEAFMLQTVSPLVLQLTLFLMTAVATHLVMSFGQTLIHYKVAHHPMGGKFFRNHINFHHTHYSDAHLLSRTYLGDEGNTTPYFFVPVFLVGGCAYFLLPLNPHFQ
jgi:hypothetical protein